MKKDIEIPIGKRTSFYRLFEIAPFFLSIGALVLLVILSLVNPLLAALYLLLIILSTFVKSVAIAARTIQGYRRLDKAQKVDWQRRLDDLERAHGREDLQVHKDGLWGSEKHYDNQFILANQPHMHPKPSQIYNAVIIATYNESMDILEPTLESVKSVEYPLDKLIVVIAYEGRGGEAIENTVKELQKKYNDTFYSLQIVKHPDKLKGEVGSGKGGNITYAGKHLKRWLDEQDIDDSNVIVTTLDSDNRPHKQYFSYVTYEYVMHEDRHHLSFQPISLFLNNIWDVPAPMRVIATGNSFWNVISSTRPHLLRNFASHSQPMSALVEMDFWSVRTIVEDGHQYWRSYFHFDGKYAVIPVYVPIYQDAVLSSTYAKTLKAQFMQLRRWAYGASDIPYVADRVFTRRRSVPFFSGIAHFFRLLDSHVTLACVPLIVAFGGWVPLFLNQQASRSIVAHELPEVISLIQRVAMVGIFISIFLALKMLPPRPERYKRRRNILMLAQWLLMPVTAIVYSSFAAFNAQAHLAFAKYLDKFDVTDKVVKK